MKRCSKCDIEKEDEDFYAGKRRKDGSRPLRAHCKACVNKDALKRQKENLERTRKSAREHYRRNAEAICKERRERYAAMTDAERERERERLAAYRRDHKEEIAEKRKQSYDPEEAAERWQAYYSKNREALLEQKRQYRENLSEEAKARVSANVGRWKRNNPEKVACHRRVEVALKRGELVKPDTCQRCHASGKLDSHHEDYSKPLEVIWVCRQCHASIHKYSKGQQKVFKCN